MSAKAKKDRDELELKLLGAHQAILELCGNSPLQRAGKRAADRKLGDLENIWEKLVSSHREYCKHAGLGLDSEESKEFIFSKQKLKDEAYFTVEKAQGEDDSTSDEGKIRRMKKTVAVLQREVGFNLPALADYGNEALNSEAFKQALEMLEDTENKVRRYVDLSATIEDLLDDAEAEEYGKTVDTVHIQHGTQLSKLRGLIGRKAPEKKEIKPEVNAMQAPSGRVGGSLGGKLPVKIKPLDCPTWDGKFKTFGRFKKMWSENITPRHEESALHFMLCQALPKHILDNISTLTNSAEEIWNYLDEKYGRSEVVAREIMAELMSLDPKRLGSRFIGKFCTTLMDTHSLLKSINEEDWLVGNRTVSELEVKLPREEKLEWARQYSTLPGVTKFERFKEFLQQRKTVMEVLESMGEMSGGGSGSSKCGYCSKPGHAEDQCFTKQRDQAGNQSGRKKFDGCAICGSDGHWKNECPEKGTSRDKRSGGGRGGSTNSTRIRSKGGKGGGKGGGGGDGSGGAADGDGGHSTGADIGSNTLRPLECQRCKFSSKFSSCAGCKKTSNIGHCLLHCPNFNLLSVNDKVAIVKSSKSCAICLHPSHTSDKCDYRDRDKNICGFDGCKSHHHPCLHGSKDTYVTGVNVLLMQQVKECVEIESWFDRQQYVHDSFALDTTSGKTKTRREEELEEIKDELSKPLINGDKVLMTIMNMSVKYSVDGVKTDIVGFFDDGSNCSVIRTALAEKLELWGEPVTLELGTVNATTTIKTKLYCVELLARDGERYLVKAFGLESLSGPLPTICLDGISHEFSTDVRTNWDQMNRPTGEVDILIGSEVAHLHPVHFETMGRMVVKKSIFGSGWVLNGAHNGINCGGVEFDRNVQIIRSGSFRSNRITVRYKQEANIVSWEEQAHIMSSKQQNKICSMEDQLKKQVNISTLEEEDFILSEESLTENDFMAGEALGCEPPRRCISCKGCPDCSFRTTQMTPQQAMELSMMEERINFDPSVGKWRVSYPFLQDPKVLVNNYKTVLRMAETLERRLEKKGLTAGANEVFHKMISNGALVEISQAMLDMWDGPEHYLPIQAVVSEKSVTTPIRLVTNSSLIDPSTGLSLNAILAKGPKALNDIWEVFVRFRNQEVGLSGDISKAYYQMLTGLLEMHVRRVLWRDGPGTPWKIYGFVVVSMGDTPAATFMELTKRKTADMAKHIDEVAAKKIKEDSFVDDLSTGGTKEECLRFKGVEDPVTLLCDGTFPQILAKGGFEVKAIALSGEKDGEALKKLGGAVFGFPFSTENDTMEIKFRVNVSEHRRKKPTGPDLTLETLDQLQTAVLTKRVCLRVVASQYDMVGIVSPLTIIMKSELKNLYQVGLDWDQPLEGELREDWVRMFETLVRTGSIKFVRATRPVAAVGPYFLICFFDGSNKAYAMVVYARWVMEDGSVVVRLVASKAKVAPMYATSTPRMELEGATLLTRVLLKIVLALNEDPPAQIFCLGDSECILASREKTGGFFGEFFGNRLGEQHDNQEKIEKLVKVGNHGEWYFVPGAQNAADRPTRLDSVPADLSMDSVWMNGPAYLKLPVEEWPMNRDFASRKGKIRVPVEEVLRKHRSQVESDQDLVIIVDKVKVDVPAGGPGGVENYVLEYFDHGRKTNSWEKLVRSTSFLFYWVVNVRVGSSNGMSLDLLAREMATIFWMRVAMPATNKAAMEGKLKHLSPKQHRLYPDMLVVVGRAASGMRHHFQQDYLPILMAKTRTAWLIMLWSHCQDHGGVDTTFQTSLQVAWIVGGRVLARSIKKSCVRCRSLAKQLADQQMSILPPFLSVPSPCFSYVAVDLAGPFICKKEGGSKVTRRNSGTVKVWAVIFVCLQVKAVKIYLAGGLNTEDYLLVWDSFVADYGQPMVAYSDRGTNLVSAAKEGGDKGGDLPKYDWDRIEDYNKGKTVWEFHPAGSQFRNGAVESFVKKFKRSLKHKFAEKLMFMLELQASFKVVASILNSRPIYARWGNRGSDDPDYLSPLTPNMLLTGRANTQIPVRDYDTSDRPLCRLKYVEECVAQWWQQYISQNFSSLVPRQKWYYERRNMATGDVVMIKYEGKCAPASYRLGVVTAVEVESDGLVRTVEVEYSILTELPASERLLYKGITKKRIKVAVQRLVLILPVEERELNSFCGGQAGMAACGEQEHGDETVTEGLGDQVDEGVVSAGHDEQAGEEVQVTAVEAEHSDPVGEVVHVLDYQGVNRNSVREAFRSCQLLKSKVKCEDYEKTIYLNFAKTYDWSGK